MVFRVSVFPRTRLLPSVCQSPPDQPSTSTMTLMTSVVSRPGSETVLHQLNILDVNQSTQSTDPVLIFHIKYSYLSGAEKFDLMSNEGTNAMTPALTNEMSFGSSQVAIVLW